MQINEHSGVMRQTHRPAFSSGIGSTQSVAKGNTWWVENWTGSATGRWRWWRVKTKNAEHHKSSQHIQRRVRCVLESHTQTRGAPHGNGHSYMRKIKRKEMQKKKSTGRKVTGRRTQTDKNKYLRYKCQEIGVRKWTKDNWDYISVFLTFTERLKLQ